MKIKDIFALGILLSTVLCLYTAKAQPDSKTDAKEQSGTKSSAVGEEIFDDDELDYIFNIPATIHLIGIEKPTLELQYSALLSTHKEIPNSTIAGFGFLEGRVGSTRTISKKHSILHEYGKYLYFGGGSTSLGMMQTAEGAKTTLWRFGLGDRSGRGWEFGGGGLILYYGSAMAWSNFSLDDTAMLAQQPKLSDFHDAFRFGKSTEGGAAFKIGENIAITLGYEQTAVFPRHLPFYWILGEAIEGIAQGAVEAFTRAVGKSSPNAAPVVGFLLHNGIGIGAGLLKKSKMNWPFDTAPALLQNGIRFGASFRF